MAGDFRESRRYSYGDDYSTVQQGIRDEIEAKDEPSPGLGEIWDASTERNWIHKSRQSQKELGTGIYSRPVDEEEQYLSNDELAEQYGIEYSDQEIEVLQGATNEEQLSQRLDKIDEQRENARLRAEAGLTGFGVDIVAGMTDPTMLPLYFLTGGLGAGARGLSVGAKALRAGAGGVVEGIGTEALLAEGDTQSDWRDVLLSGAAGGIVTGGLSLGGSGISRAVRGKKQKPSDIDSPNPLDENPDAARAAQAYDEALMQDAKMRREEIAISDLEQKLNIKSVQSMDAEQNLRKVLFDKQQNRLTRKERKDLKAELRMRQDRMNKAQRVKDKWDKQTPAGGTKRSRAEQARKASTQRKNAQRRLDDADTKLKRIQRKLEADDVKRRANADLSRLNQGQMPKEYRELFDQLHEAARQDNNTPFQNRESMRVRELAKEAREKREAQAAERAAQERAAMEPDAEGKVDPQGDTRPDTGDAGAARVEGAKDESQMYPLEDSVSSDERLYEMQQVGESLGARDKLRKAAGLGTNKLSSAYSNMLKSASNTIRGIGHTMLSDPQASNKGHIPMSHHADAYERRMLSIERGREMQAMDDYAKEIGVKPYRLAMGEGSVLREFDNRVVLEMQGIDQGSKAIKDAAEARADSFEFALKISKQTGRRGYENVESDRTYFSTIFNNHKMSRAANETSRDHVIDLMTGAYMNGKYKLSETSARKVAQAQYARTMNRNVGDSKMESKMLSKQDYAVLREELEDAGVPTDRIDEYLTDLEEVREREGISDRAKFSLEPDKSYELNGLRMVDVIDTSKRVVDRYNQDAATGAAMAKKGFKTREELESTIDDAQRQAKSDLKDEGLSTEAYNKAAAKIDDEIETLRMGVKLMHRESIDNDSAWVEGSRKARKLTNLAMLQWNGIVSTAEGANAMVNFGTSAFRSYRPTDFFSFGKVRESEDLQGMYDIMGAYGQLDASIRDRDYSLQTMDEGEKGRVSRIFDNFTGSASNKSQLFSGFRSVQHGLENHALRSMQDRLVRIANGDLKMKQRDWDEWQRSGLTENQVRQLFQHIKDNPEYSPDGKQIFSGKGLDPDMFDDVSAAMGSMLSRNMQKSFVGDTPIMMEKEMGKLLTVFRAFSIASAEKQLASGMRGDKVGFAMKIALGTFLANTAYTSRAWVRSQLTDDPEEEFEKYMDAKTHAQGVLNMSPHLGMFGIGTEMLYGLGVGAEDDGSRVTRSGTRNLSIGGIIPTVGLAEDAASGVYNIASGLVQGDSDVSKKGGEQLRDITPIINSAAIGTAQAIAHSLND